MSKIVSEATAHRATFLKSPQPGKHFYSVTFDGALYQYIEASDLPQARGIVRKALRAAYDSPWNQSMIFRGDLQPGEVSVSNFLTALRHEIEALQDLA